MTDVIASPDLGGRGSPAGFRIHTIGLNIPSVGPLVTRIETRNGALGVDEPSASERKFRDEVRCGQGRVQRFQRHFSGLVAWRSMDCEMHDARGSAPASPTLCRIFPIAGCGDSTRNPALETRPWVRTPLALD